MTTTPTLTTALTNALPVLSALIHAAILQHDHMLVRKVNRAIDLVHISHGTMVAEAVISVFESAPWFRKGQPVIDELRRFL